MNARVDGFFRAEVIRRLALGAAGACLVFAAGCNMPSRDVKQINPTSYGAPPVESGDGGPVVADPAPYSLVPGDRIAIKVVQDPMLDGEYTIDSDGGIQYPYIGPMRLEGLTTVDARRKIGSGLKEYYTDPFVTVNLISQMQQYVRVMGQVPKQGRIPFERGMTIVDGIAEAGGLTRDASQKRIVLIRRVSEDQVAAGFFNYRDAVLSPNAQTWASNIPLRSGDIIFVPTNERAQWESAFNFISVMFGAAVDVERSIVLYPDVREIIKTGNAAGRNTIVVR
ncbi:MAG: polysaccharide export protein [Phycisphaerales bacterium]|nr:polysaccharide export protein [Phycisphaerales bacterium]